MTRPPVRRGTHNATKRRLTMDERVVLGTGDRAAMADTFGSLDQAREVYVAHRAELRGPYPAHRAEAWWAFEDDIPGDLREGPCRMYGWLRATHVAAASVDHELEAAYFAHDARRRAFLRSRGAS